MADTITKNIGKNTIGDNNKMSVSMRKYQRSTHDLSYAWRNTQTVGTLVPFMCEVGLPGDTWELHTEASVLTHPTVGPLFGSFKLQGEYYVCPIRLYNGLLHNNALGIGLKMSQVKLPKIQVSINGAYDYASPNNGEYTQINPSCLLSYLGLKGYGNIKGSSNIYKVKKNITAALAYWDIFKNYHANKQETNAYYIGKKITLTTLRNESEDQTYNINAPVMYIPLKEGDTVIINATGKINAEDIIITTIQNGVKSTISPTQLGNVTNMTNGIKISITNQANNLYAINIKINKIDLISFPLENIDNMRENLLTTGKGIEYIINEDNATEPYLGLCSKLGERLKTKEISVDALE